ncbi:MAG: dTDP-glucose 4,6-dehydratase [Candidatus Omnitrophica bacterium]|nr:dTDP-glucose 4,6-dehydratase [Candidatus Omnitrophota bacterium]
MRKILVTGGAGFIGSNFIRYILNKHNDCYIINLDKLTYAGNRNNLKDIYRDPRYKFVKGDICDRFVVDRLAKECDTIINFAAESHVDRSIKKAASFVESNINGVRVLLDAAKKYKVPRFLQISTDEVYGSIIKGHSKEGDPLRPSSPYAATKAAADLLCLSYITTYKIPIIITRSSNNFGEYQFPEKIMPLFITNLHEDKKVPLYADGMNRRDWIYVLDNCEAIDCVLEKGRTGEIYNIGAGSEKTNLELTHLILKVMNKPMSFIQHVEDRPGHDKRYGLDCKKLKQLGYKPRYDFYKALEFTVEWYRDNEWWWRPLKKGR